MLQSVKPSLFAMISADTQQENLAQEPSAHFAIEATGASDKQTHTSVQRDK
jgi:hypothetical protein